VVGVWLEDNRLIVYNGDLTGRVISINADRWRDTELREVISDGGALLGVTFHPDFIDALLKNCLDSVYLVQEVCRRTCVRSGVTFTVEDGRTVGAAADVGALVKEVVDEQSARYMSFLNNFADGFQATELEMYRWLLYPILTAKPGELENGLRFRDIREIMHKCHPRKDSLNVGNLSQALQSAASLQTKKNIMPIVIDYDQTGKKLNIVDKGFLIWLNYQDVPELMADLGIDVDIE